MPTDSTTTRPAARPWLPIAFLALVTIGHIVLSAWWMRSNGFFSERPPYQDAGYFRVDSWHMMRGWQQGGVVGWLRAGFEHDRPHPPLLPMLAALTSLPEGEVNVESQWRVEMLFLALLAVVGFRLARNFGGRWFAALTSAAILSAPVLLVTARVFYHKFPMIVVVLAALDALLRSRAFTRRGYSLAFGALSGLAVLTFMIAPLYLAGSALAAFLIGMARARKPTVILNAVLATVACGAVCSLWYPFHWTSMMRYATDVTGSAGQVRFSKGVPLWSAERWLFYPRALLNAGLGFFLSCWVAAALLVRLGALPFRKRRPSTPGDSFDHAPGWTLAAGALVSFLLVVPGQTAGYAEYVINLAPLGILLVTASIAAIRAKWLKVVLATLLGATCLFTICLTYRPLYEDNVGLELGSIHVVDMYDRYGGMAARDHGVRAVPEGEPWPVKEFVDLMIEHAPVAELRVGETSYPYLHNYLNAGNLSYEALKRGVNLVAVSVGLDTKDPDALKEVVRKVDFMIVDRGFANGRDPEERMVGLLERLGRSGAKVVVLARRQLSDRADLALVQLVRPLERPHIVSQPALDEQGVKRVDVTFENGWRLLGVEVRLVSEDTVMVSGFWDLDAPGKPGFEMFFQVGDDKTTIATGQQSLIAPRVPAGQTKRLAVCTAYAKVPGVDPNLKVRLGVRIRGGGQKLEDHSPHIKTDRPEFGRFMVYVAP